MRTISKLFLVAVILTFLGCNKSTPPPQKPVTPRSSAIEMPVQLPAP